MELNQSVRQFYAPVKNRKCEPCGLSSDVGLRERLNCYINDPPISRSWCLMKDPAFTTSNNVFIGVVKKNSAENDVTAELHN